MHQRPTPPSQLPDHPSNHRRFGPMSHPRRPHPVIPSEMHSAIESASLEIRRTNRNAPHRYDTAIVLDLHTQIVQRRKKKCQCHVSGILPEGTYVTTVEVRNGELDTFMTSTIAH